jgi:hypothetical protein
MSIYQYKAGLQNAASYQSSGSPFVTGSTPLIGVQRVDFPNVTKNIQVWNLDANTGTSHNIYVYFHEDTPLDNKIHVPAPQSRGTGHVDLDIKCTHCFISSSHAHGCDVRLYASLTGIEPKQMFELTGSGITE